MTSVAFIGAASGVNTAATPAHAVGDFIIGIAFVDGSTTAPTLPAGFTQIHTNSGGSNAIRVGYKIAASSSEDAGTWTGATAFTVAVYRGLNTTTPFGAVASSAALAASVTWTARTVLDKAGRNAVLRWGGHRSVNTAIETPPAGFTLRNQYLDSVNEAVLFDRLGTTDDVPQEVIAVGGTSSNWRTIQFELLAALPQDEQRMTAAVAMIGITAGGPDSENRVTTAPVMIGVTVETTDAAIRATAVPVLVGVTVAAAAVVVSGRRPAINWN